MKLGNCGRCFNPTRAVTSERMTVGGDTYDLELCDAHADMFRRDMYGWARCGSLYEEPRTFTPRTRDEDRRRGTVLACHIQVPVARSEQSPPAAQRKLKAAPEPQQQLAQPTLQLMDLPPGYDRWTFSDHAIERMGLRKVRPELALWAACQPDRVLPGNDKDTVAHIRGHVRVVVNPTLRTIITVIDTTLTTNQEYMDAASA